jgi:hypothetical protein
MRLSVTDLLILAVIGLAFLATCGIVVLSERVQ